MSSRDQTPAIAAGLPSVEAAIAFARARHAGQLLGDGRAFVEHPLEVGSRLHRAHAPEHLVVAGVLHDVIEKADVSEALLRRRFGARVTRLVLAVTDDESISGYAARKAALRQQVSAAGLEALTLFAADKLSMSRELKREIKRHPDADPGLRARRLKHYQRSPAMLEDQLPESRLVRALKRELSAFDRQPLVAQSLS